MRPKRVVGVDVDNNLCRDSGDPRFISAPTQFGVALLQALRNDPQNVVCIWTCRPTYLVTRWLVEHKLLDYVDHINDSPIPADDRKLPFHVYLGDDAVNTIAQSVAEVLTRVNSYAPQQIFMRDRTFASEAPALMYRGTGEMYLSMHDSAWKDLWQDLPGKRVALLTICSHAKPYAKSYIHASVRQMLHNANWLHRVQYTHISNAGIVPTEHGTTHPWSSYDWDNTRAETESVIALRKKMIRDLTWWRDNVQERYDRTLVYLRAPGNTSDAARIVFEGSDDTKFCFVSPCEPLPWMLEHDLDDTLTVPEHLRQLWANLEGLL